jgi:PAS domain S-box-containing protein
VRWAAVASRRFAIAEHGNIMRATLDGGSGKGEKNRTQRGKLGVDTGPLQSLLDNLEVGIALHDAHGRIVVSNRRLTSFFDVPCDFLAPGDPIEKLLAFLHARGDYESEAQYQKVLQAIREGPRKAFRYERARPNGRFLEIKGRPEAGGGFIVTVTDVTERHDALKELRLSEERFRDFTAAASHFQWETDAELRITNLSSSYESFAARDECEIIGRRLWEIVGIPEPDKDPHWAGFMKGVRSREPIHDFLYAIRAADGALLHRRTSARPVFDAAGCFTGYRFATRDVTAEIETQQRAQRAEELLAQAVEAMSEGLALYDPEDRLVFINKLYFGDFSRGNEAFRQGLLFEEVIRRDVAERLILEPSGDAFIAGRLAVHREGKGRPMLFRTADGRWSQVRDYRRQDGGTLVVRLDVTELLEREKALSESRASLAIAQRIARLGSWELNLMGPIGSESNRLHWSDETFRIFGYEPGEVEVTNDLFYDCVHREDRDRVREAARRAVVEGIAYDIEYRVLRALGGEIIVHERSDVLRDRKSGLPLRMVGTVQDITEQKRIERALQDYQAHLDLALRTARIAHWELDLAHNTHRLDSNYYRMLGYSESEAPTGRQAWRKLVHPDDIARLDAQQMLPPNDTSDHDYEFRIRGKDGSWRWFLSHFRAVGFDGFGRPARLLGVDIDITARKQIELELRLARDRAQLYLDIAGVIIVVLNVDHSIALLNRKGCEILGVKEEEVLGRDWFEIFSPDEEREAQRAIYAAFIAGERGPSQDIDMSVTTRSGEERIVTWHDRLLRDASGAVIGGLSSGEDVTEQRAAEHKRDEYHALVEATSQASPDGVVVVDPQSRYLLWNKRYQEMWGFSDEYMALRESQPPTPETLKPLTDQLVAPEDIIGRTKEMCEQASPGILRQELSLKDGRVFVSHAARVSSGTPPIEAVAWIYRDVTEEKQKDAELAQNQRLTAIGQLSGGMAHELNNLLTVICGNLELIHDMKADERAVTALTNPALGAVERGAELIQSLLAFSRQQPLAPQTTDVGALISNVLRMMPHLLGTGITVHFSPAGDLWRTVIDPGQLQTALINLATNARDAMPKGGMLSIETRNRTFEEEEPGELSEIAPGDYVEIAVTDEGEGMPPDVAARAFEPFFTTKEVGKGTGLGLSMVFGFVKQSGGHVSLYSEPGHGTTVRLYLPRSAPEPKEEPKLVPAPARPRGETVLLVEDEPAVSAVAQAILGSLGYRVIEAADGPQALAVIDRGDPIDLLFTDVILPQGMNGAEVAAQARARRPDLKVLFCSGYTKEALIHQGRLDPEVSLLQKPYRRHELAQAVESMLEHR